MRCSSAAAAAAAATNNCNCDAENAAQPESRSPKSHAHKQLLCPLRALLGLSHVVAVVVVVVTFHVSTTCTTMRRLCPAHLLTPAHFGARPFNRSFIHATAGRRRSHSAAPPLGTREASLGREDAARRQSLAIVPQPPPQPQQPPPPAIENWKNSNMIIYCALPLQVARRWRRPLLLYKVACPSAAPES